MPEHGPVEVSQLAAPPEIADIANTWVVKTPNDIGSPIFITVVYHHAFPVLVRLCQHRAKRRLNEAYAPISGNCYSDAHYGHSRSRGARRDESRL